MSIANSSYHSLQTSWNRRFGAGFSLLGSFTWSKALDLASNDGGGGLGNQANNPFKYSAACWCGFSPYRSTPALS